MKPTRLWVCVAEREATGHIPNACIDPARTGHEACGWFDSQRVNPDLLAGRVELAARYDVKPNTVAVWTQRHADFPEPLIQVGGRVRVWWVPDVDEWVENRKG